MSQKWRHEIDKTPCANCGHPRNEHRIRHPSYPDIHPPGVWCPEPRGGKQYAAPDPGPADYFICVKECARAEIALELMRVISDSEDGVGASAAGWAAKAVAAIKQCRNLLDDHIAELEGRADVAG
jgi:hypothetical protein